MKISPNLFKILKEPIGLSNKAVLMISVILTSIIILVYRLINRSKSLKQMIFEVFPRTMLKDCLIEFNGAKFLARRGKTDILVLNEFSEPWMKHYFKPEKGDVVIDVGAHVGKYALTAANLVRDEGIVIAIEAHPENFDALLKNISLNGFKNVIPLNVAAFNKDDEQLRLFGSRDNGYSLKAFPNTGGVNVRAKRIDSIVENLNIKKVDWVKIDVEGAEVEVLEGMEKIVTRFSPKILIEVHLENMRKIDDLLKNFRKKILGGDDPKILNIFYWKDKN